MKKGVTLTVLAATVVIMFILIGVSSAIGISSIKTAAYEEFMSKVKRVSDYVNEYYLENEELPIGTEIVSKEGLEDSLKAEINRNNDNNNNLYVVDMSRINTESVNIGKGTVSDLDVFLVAENTHNVYYLKGISYKGKTYHGVEIVVKPLWTQNGLTITKGKVTLEAGDLIQYNAGVSGYEGAWKVLGAEDGKLLIMSTIDICSLHLWGLEGYENQTNYGLLNGISRLNELSEPYGTGMGAIGARSIKVEDVDKLTGYDKTTYRRGKYRDQYGNEVTYSWNSEQEGKVDYTSSNGKNGTLSTTHSNGFSYVNFETMTNTTVAVNSSGLPKITNSGYSYNVSDTTLPTKSEKATEMIFGNSAHYWFASPFVSVSSAYVKFGLFYTNGDAGVGCADLLKSSGSMPHGTIGVRAVVELSPNIKIGTKDSTLGWNYTM